MKEGRIHTKNRITNETSSSNEDITIFFFSLGRRDREKKYTRQSKDNDDDECEKMRCECVSSDLWKKVGKSVSPKHMNVIIQKIIEWLTV